MRTPDEIDRKIAELRRKATSAEPTFERARARHQIFALEWTLGKFDDENDMDWIKTALDRLGPEARTLFPHADKISQL